MSGVRQQLAESGHEKTFYLETFGCQMNVHDSEKVVGTLLQQGYRQVETVEQAGLILYNTCSIRDKAEQKVFHRLADFKKLQAKGKKFGVLGCVAQQEGEKIFERAPHVSLVCGSASYNNLPQMLVQLEGAQPEAEIDVGSQDPLASSRSGAFLPAPRGISPAASPVSDGSLGLVSGDARGLSRNSGPRTQDLVRITGLDDRQTDKCFETEFTARTNPHRGYITIIEGCDKFCAYCVVPFTRGKERSRTSGSVLAEARQIVDLGYTEIQLLGQNVNSYRDPDGKKSFAELLAAVGEIPGIRRVRFTTSHPRDFGRDIVDAIDAVPALCDHVHLPVQSGSSRVLDAMQRLYTREQYLERIEWMKTARREISITTDVIVGFPGETEADFAETLSLLEYVGYDGVFSFKYSPRPNTPALHLDDAIPEQEKSRRLEVLMAKQREIQVARYRKYVGTKIEVMVEGRNESRNQWIGRTSQNKTLNFTASANPKVGSYTKVLVTGSFPNSLLGEMVA
ncbi:MAG TPA: MiaB/RimO family radical SAM methylthiotransferase [Verrucomicrobiae bacterium]|nr:MiaB/RimO family radical SAM methylthiotransferase [Verrucomicrobiae bacterium]